MDLASGYWQMNVCEKDKPKTAFATHRGLYQFKRMPFGLANSPASFERLMEIVLTGLQWERCLVYLDDVIVFGRSFDETLKNLTVVFERLRSANLKLKPKKCVLFEKEVSYLGHIVSEEGVKCDPGKLNAIKDWPTPTNISDVRSFLGIASYYRKFISNFSTTAFPLTNLTRKNQKFVWSEQCEECFKSLKNALISAPVLSYPTRDDPFILDTDASGYGIGAVLSQVQDGEERVIAYGSKTLSKTQMRYCTTFRELLAAVVFVKHFKHYLYGRPFLLRTDHSSLTWLKNFKDPEGMVARWISVLETFDFEIKHRKGVLHGNADALSRRPRRSCKRDACPQCGPDGNSDCHAPVSAVVKATKNRALQRNQQRDIADDTVGREDDSQELQPNEILSNWLQQWTNNQLQDLQHEDQTIRSAIDIIQTSGETKPRMETSNPELKTLLKQWELLTVENSLLWRRWENEDGSSHKQFVTPTQIRQEILQHLHDSRTASHFGRDRTLAKVRERFYWPGMTDDIARWCQTCLPCQQRKPGPGRGKAPMRHCHVYGPMECIAIDLMGPLPITDNGNQYIMVVSDYFSKWTEAYPLKEHCAQTVADKLVTEFICRFGTPYRIHTDQGREFESKLFAGMCELLEISKTRTTPYHPQSDGMVERYNRTLQQTLSMFVNENHDDWDDHLPYVTMAYRACVHESTKCSPNLLMLGRETALPIDIITGYQGNESESIICPSEYVEWMQNTMTRSFELANENLHSSFKKQKRYYDHKLKQRNFEIGSQVLRWYPPKAHRKLGLGWTGPYIINRKLSDITYEIEDCKTFKLKVVHVDHLKPLQLRQNDTTDEILTENNADSTQPLEYETRHSDDICVSTSASTPKVTRKGRHIKPPLRFSP